MNAAVTKDYRTALYTPSITKPAIISALLHIGVFVLATVGIPYLSKDVETEDMVIPVELFDPSEVIETTNPDEPQKSEEEDIVPPPERKPVYNNSETVPELAVPEEPDIPEPEEIIPEEPPKIVPPDPSEIKKPPKPKSKPKPPPKPKVAEEKPKEETKPERNMDSLLNDLTPRDDEETQPSKVADGGKGQDSQVANIAESITSSELSQLHAGIGPCWNVDIGMLYSEDAYVVLLVTVNRDRTVKSAEILVKDTFKYNSNQRFKVSADAAIRALLDPKCRTLRLPENKYDQWKQFMLPFDPSSMLR